MSLSWCSRLEILEPAQIFSACYTITLRVLHQPQGDKQKGQGTGHWASSRMSTKGFPTDLTDWRRWFTYCHTEPTHEARAETKLALAMPCKKEEGRRSKPRNWRSCFVCRFRLAKISIHGHPRDTIHGKRNLWDSEESVGKQSFFFFFFLQHSRK